MRGVGGYRGSLRGGGRVDGVERRGLTLAVRGRDERAREVVVVDPRQRPREVLRFALVARERGTAGDRLAVFLRLADEAHDRGRARVDPRGLVLVRLLVEAPRLLALDRRAELDGGFVELHEAAAEDRLAVRFALELRRRAAGAELELRDDGPVARELRELRMFGAGRRGGRILDEPRRARRGRGTETEQCEAADHGLLRVDQCCWKNFAARSRICAGVSSSILVPIDQRWPNGSVICP